MKFASLTKVALIFAAIACSAGAHAQFGGKSLPGLSSGGGSATASENPSDVVKNAKSTLLSFVSAKLGLIEAVKGAEAVAAQKQTLENLKKGDAAATPTKEDMETVVSLDKETGDVVNKMAADNAKIDAKSKALAGKSMVEYVKGLGSAKKTVTSVGNLSKNPMSLGSNLGSITYLAKELPSIVSAGTSTTSTLFTYLNSNGVDTSEAKKAAGNLGV